MNRIHTMSEKQLERSIRRVLLMKELRESRAAIVAGAFIFLGLPLIWNFVLSAMDHKRECYPGIATGLLAGAGWLFSAVLAAQTVCRDFGRKQGDFLLARPVTPGQVVRAKAAAGSGIVLVLVISVFTLDGILMLINGDYKYWYVPWSAIFVIGGACLIMFWLAFAAAAVTRHTLSGVMLAVLTAVILIALPLVTSSLATCAIAGAGAVKTGMTSCIAQLAEWLPTYVPYPEEWTAKQSEMRNLYGDDQIVAFLIHAHPPYKLLLIPSVSIAGLFAGLGWLIRFLHERRTGQGARCIGRSIGSAIGRASILAVALLCTFALWDITPLVIYLLIWLIRLVARGVAGRAVRSERTLRVGTKSIAWTVGLAMILLFALAMREVGANLPVTATHWRDTPSTQTHDVHNQIPCVKFAIGRNRVAMRRTNFGITLFDIEYDLISRHLNISEEFRFDVRRPFMVERSIPVFDSADQLWLVSIGYPLAPLAEDANTCSSQPEDRRSIVVDGQSYKRSGATRVLLRRVDWATGEFDEPIELPRPADLPTDNYAWTICDAAWSGDRLYVAFLIAGNQSELQAYMTSDTRYDLTAVYRIEGDGRVLLEHASRKRGFSNFAVTAHFGRGLDGKTYFLSPWALPLNPSDQVASNWHNAAIFSDGAPILGTLPISKDRFVGADQDGFYVAEKKAYEPPARLTKEVVASTIQGGFKFELIVILRTSPWAWLFRSSSPRLLAAGDHLIWEVHEAAGYGTSNDPDETLRQGSAFCYDVSDPRHPRRIAHVTTWPILDSYAGPEYLLLDHGAGFSIVRNPKGRQRGN